MSDETQGNTPVTVPSPRRLFTIAVFAAVLGLIVTLSFGYADHDPQPHKVRLAVSAPAAVSQKLAAGLAKQAPGGFTLVAVDSPSAALASVRSQSSLGGLIVRPSGPNTIITAGAQGTTASTVITKVLTAASTAMHRKVTAADVAPLTSGDHSGLGAFVFGLGLLVPSVIGSVGLFLLGNRMRLWWRVLASLVFAVLAACGGTLAMDTIFGALTGNGGALIGIGALGAASFVLFVAAIQSLVGLPGTGLAGLAFIFVGNAISGGSVPIQFLPNVFRQVAPWLPNNAIVRGVRDVIYYNGTDLGHVFLVLGLWPAVSLLILLGVDVLHLRARARMPELIQEIYSTPGIVHLRAQFGGHHPSKLRPGAAAHPVASAEAEAATESAATEAAAPRVTEVSPLPLPAAAPTPAGAPTPAAAPAAAAPVFSLHMPGSAPTEDVTGDDAEMIAPVSAEAPAAASPEHHAPELPANSGFPHVPVFDAPGSAPNPEPAQEPEPPTPAPTPAPASTAADEPPAPADGRPVTPTAVEQLSVTADRVTIAARAIVISGGEITIHTREPAPWPDQLPLVDERSDSGDPAGH